MNRLFQAAAITVILLGGSPAGSEEEDPAARWLGVYGWIQTAERLAGADQWPLALGSYLEANRLLTALAEAHPAFEPEMVAYRRDALAKTIAETEARLTTDEHETMMKYLDFIESFELGENQRYDNEFEAALGTLGMARALLDEIISEKPAEFREAVASQYERLRSGIEWLDSQVNFKARSRPAVLADDTVDWGTTRFVKESDLPGDPAATPLSLALFPPSMALAIAAAAEPVPPSTPAAMPPAAPADPVGPRRFRMNSRQDSADPAPVPPAPDP
jgi:hypothetical protein